MSEKNKNQRNNNEGDSFAEGLKIRKAVLGEDYIEGAIKANSNQFSWKLQEIITKWAWNDNWNDDILSLKVRSLITLALMTALNIPTEFEIHLRGAINNGVTVEELRSVLLHTAVYCGIPAALDSFNIARDFLISIGKDLDNLSE